MKKRGTNNIEEYRKQLHFDEKRLAERVEEIASEHNMKTKLYWKTIMSIEKGKYKPTLDLAILLAKALDSTVEEVFNLD